MISSVRCSAMKARTSGPERLGLGLEAGSPCPAASAGRSARPRAPSASGASAPQRRCGDRAELVAGVAEQQAGGLGPAHVELHVVLEHEAVAAVDVEAEAGGLLGHLAAEPRRPGRPGAGRVGSSSSRAHTRLVGEEPGAVDAGVEVGEAVLEGLEAADRHAELVAVLARTARRRRGCARARPAWATAVRARHSSTRGGEGGDRVGAHGEHGGAGAGRRRRRPARPACGERVRPPVRPRVGRSTTTSASPSQGHDDRGDGGAGHEAGDAARRAGRSARAATAPSTTAAERGRSGVGTVLGEAGQQPGDDRRLHQGHGAEVGAVDLHGGGEVGERGAGAAVGLGQRPWPAGPWPPRPPTAAGRSPWPPPLAPARRATPWRRGAGRPPAGRPGRAVKERSMGASARSIAFLTGRQTLCHHHRAPWQIPTPRSSSTRSSTSWAGAARAYMEHTRDFDAGAPPAEAWTSWAPGRSSAPPGAGPRS